MSQAPPRTVLEIDQLCVKFGGLVAISSMSFHVDHGEIVSLIGPNGAGKTTAFNAITGYLQPSSGEARFLDKSLNGLKPNQIAELGVVRTFQKTSLFGGNTAFENIMIALHRQGRQELFGSLLRLPNMHAEERRLRDRADEILEFFGIAARRDELASAMPYGEQRLLEVAIGLATEPEVLLLDEPASGMNPTETMSFVRMVERIREQDITILLVEHDMRMVMGVSDRVVVLNQGEIIASGPPSEIKHDPEVVRAYLGTSAPHA